MDNKEQHQVELPNQELEENNSMSNYYSLILKLKSIKESITLLENNFLK